MSFKPGNDLKNVPSPTKTIVFDCARGDCLFKAFIA